MKRILLPILVMVCVLVVGLVGLTGCETTTPRPFPPPPSEPSPPTTEQPSIPPAETPTPAPEPTPAPAPEPTPTPPPKEQQTYTLSISINPSGAGSVSPSDGHYESGAEVMLSATPASGYSFDYWDGDASGSSATITVIMDSDKSVIALFSIVDIAPPIISRVEVSNITETGARITWTTDEPATSQTEYGKTTDYGLTSTLDEKLATNHTVSLTELDPNTTYHFRVKSEDEIGNETTSNDNIFATSKPATKVSGIISGNTIWTEESSPYVIISTIQIPAGVTLTIEPGVTITMPSDGDMFLLHGTISARGTLNNKIIFDGGGDSNIFITWGGTGNANLDYCIIRNSQSLWERGRGYFSMTHSEIINGGGISLSPPLADVYIEYNRFINSGTITTYQASGFTCNVYVRYNLFHSGGYIRHQGGLPGLTEMIVQYNSFIDIDGTILSLAQDFDTTILDATENYWDTLDTDAIDLKIHDRNDDVRVKNYIDYLPILTEPHQSTPTP